MLVIPRNIKIKLLPRVIKKRLLKTLTSYSGGVVEIRITSKSELNPVDTRTRLWTYKLNNK